MASNARIAADLDEIADLLELQDANPFRVRAYRNAARTVRDADGPVRTRVEAGEDLRELPGIGKDIAAQIVRKVRGAEMDALAELRAAVPRGLLDVVRVPGVGPKKARALWSELGVESLDALEAAAKEGRIEALKGFGAKTQERIVQGVASVRRFAERRRRADAEAALVPLLAWLREDDAVQRLEVAGSFRRGRDTVGDVDLLVVTDDPTAVMARFRDYEETETVLGSGEDKTSLVLADGLQVDLRAVSAAAFGAALLYFTGSKAHNVRLRRRANERDATLNEYGLWTADGGERIAGADEEEVYEALGLPWIPPELREDRGEIEAAEERRLPRLIRADDVVADLHTHSDWSDGSATLREMQEAAAARGLAVLAVTDHSPALKMTGGLDRDKLLRQWEALDELDGAVPGLTVLRGMEVDILADGTLDMDDDLLARMDVVVVSVHGRFELDEARQTERVVTALAHPSVNVLGHPTGRLLGQRDGFAIDLDAVIAAAREHDVALEINAHPARLDLDDRWARVAAKAGVPIAINTDAHAPAELGLLPHGVLQARRAWLEPRQVINTWPLPRLRRFLSKDPGWRED
ncbi:MAG: DNA polymerase/3'-5' exonuclease PolX [Trueperaceae bacterium]|nr:DNA polymerase/3'-5' exonuclease PolX [Trueperaceae bacterium]